MNKKKLYIWKLAEFPSAHQMKTNNIFLLFIALITFVSCARQPKCNEAEVKALVIQVIKQHISDNVKKEFEDEEFTENKNYSYFKPIIETRDELIKQLEFKINSIRTDDVKKEIKKCDCQGELNSIENSDNIDEIRKDLEDIVKGDIRIVGVSPTINYTAQITDEKKVYITVNNLNELEPFEKNISAKILYKIREKNRELLASERTAQNEAVQTSKIDEYINNQTYNIEPNKSYKIYGSPDNPVYFYKTPNLNDRKNARFTTNETVYVQEVVNNFAFIRFTNANGQTSEGWIRFQDLN